MNRTSSTTKAAGGFGGLGVIVIGAVALWQPELYERAKEIPGFTEAIAVGIATLAAKLMPEKVMREQITEELKNGG